MTSSIVHSEGSPGNVFCGDSLGVVDVAGSNSTGSKTQISQYDENLQVQLTSASSTLKENALENYAHFEYLKRFSSVVLQLTSPARWNRSQNLQGPDVFSQSLSSSTRTASQIWKRPLLRRRRRSFFHPNCSQHSRPLQL